MGKSHSSSFRNANLFHRPVAEVMPLIQAAYNRLLSLLELCDQEIADFYKRIADKHSRNPNFKDIQKVANTVLRLQKMLEQYAALLHPPVETSVETGIEKQGSTPANSTPNSQQAQSLIKNNGQPPAKKFSQEFFKRPPVNQPMG